MIIVNNIIIYGMIIEWLNKFPSWKWFGLKSNEKKSSGTTEELNIDEILIASGRQQGEWLGNYIVENIIENEGVIKTLDSIISDLDEGNDLFDFIDQLREKKDILSLVSALTKRFSLNTMVQAIISFKSIDNFQTLVKLMKLKNLDEKEFIEGILNSNFLENLINPNKSNELILRLQKIEKLYCKYAIKNESESLEEIEKKVQSMLVLNNIQIILHSKELADNVGGLKKNLISIINPKTQQEKNIALNNLIAFVLTNNYGALEYLKINAEGLTNVLTKVVARELIIDEDTAKGLTSIIPKLLKESELLKEIALEALKVKEPIEGESLASALKIGEHLLTLIEKVKLNKFLKLNRNSIEGIFKRRLERYKDINLDPLFKVAEELTKPPLDDLNKVLQAYSKNDKVEIVESLLKLIAKRPALKGLLQEASTIEMMRQFADANNNKSEKNSEVFRDFFVEKLIKIIINYSEEITRVIDLHDKVVAGAEEVTGKVGEVLQNAGLVAEEVASKLELVAREVVKPHVDYFSGFLGGNVTQISNLIEQIDNNINPRVTEQVSNQLNLHERGELENVKQKLDKALKLVKPEDQNILELEEHVVEGIKIDNNEKKDNLKKNQQKRDLLK